MVQNKPVYLPDLVIFENKIMLHLEVPRYFNFNIGKKAQLTQAEIDY